ncbi:unnamed protein product [Nesidiocoris tenuis]|uniref:Uncharacterized protein n=1 Tax=Nesidiocoris tenuis TaxID=355587 RepID=A0A6H5GI04_9HEMI|nr:unnamed protein product [Nesidiocoris tenuis]
MKTGSAGAWTIRIVTPTILLLKLHHPWHLESISQNGIRSPTMGSMKKIFRLSVSFCLSSPENPIGIEETWAWSYFSGSQSIFDPILLSQIRFENHAGGLFSRMFAIKEIRIMEVHTCGCNS